MTNQFTDEQVAREIEVSRSKAVTEAYNIITGQDESFSPESTLEALEGLWNAALEAAAGVAPQAPSERTPEFESREQELFKHQPVLSMKDAATAAIERVRALETFSITDSYPAWTAVDHDDLLAALDGAPEPEVKP